MKNDFRILIVDDDRRMTRTLADIFALEGYDIVEAWSGFDALEKLRAQDFNCILADVRMPDMDGVEFSRQLRKTKPGIPVVLMTAYAADEVIRQGLEEGVIGVFDKPLDMNHLLGFFTSLRKQQVIVIVDDDHHFCMTLGDILMRRGFSVIKITNPHADIQQITSDAQVVLLDYKLNDVNGLEVLREIHKHNPTLPVMMVTGYQKEMTAAINTVLEIKAFACLYKPLEIPALINLLTELQKGHLRHTLNNRNKR